VAHHTFYTKLMVLSLPSGPGGLGFNS